MPRLLAALLLALGLSACGVNDIPTLQEHAKAAWSEVENQYQRRADLIPNLVETVKGYAQHEQDTLEGVTARPGRRRPGQPRPGPDAAPGPGARTTSASRAS